MYTETSVYSVYIYIYMYFLFIWLLTFTYHNMYIQKMLEHSTLDLLAAMLPGYIDSLHERGLSPQENPQTSYLALGPDSTALAVWRIYFSGPHTI